MRTKAKLGEAANVVMTKILNIYFNGCFLSQFGGETSELYFMINGPSVPLHLCLACALPFHPFFSHSVTFLSRNFHGFDQGKGMQERSPLVGVGDEGQNFWILCTALAHSCHHP